MEKENRSVVLLFQCGRFEYEYALGQILAKDARDFCRAADLC